MIRVLRMGRSYLDTQVLVVARGEGDPLLLDALREGADSFYDPGDRAAEPLAAHARDTLDGNADIAPWIARHLLDHFERRFHAQSMQQLRVEDMSSPLALTPDERVLLRQLAMGLRLSDVARYEKVPPRALSARVREIYRKMQWDLRAGDLTLQAA
jgi:DNA-binding NarL/FixJ family response regulator